MYLYTTTSAKHLSLGLSTLQNIPLKWDRTGLSLPFLKMGGLPEHEGRANLVDYPLISRFSARRGSLSNHAEDAYFANR
jgi:hypothetical protein